MLRRSLEELVQRLRFGDDEMEGLSVEELARIFLEHPSILAGKPTRAEQREFGDSSPFGMDDLAAPHELRDIPRRDGLYHAQSVEHVQRLVRYAVDSGVKVRAAGARHSVGAAILDSETPGNLAIILDGDLRTVTFLHEDHARGEALVRVGAGCYLGVNPSDPRSDVDNSLMHQLDVRGYALPIVGGITHQSVAGFLQTSSSGGSLTHGFADMVERIELVNGRGEVVAFDRGSDGLNAAAVAMGLHGVVTHVTFRVTARFFVEGVEENRRLEHSWLARQADGTYPLGDLLLHNEYLHLNWFPQKYVQRVIQWKGKRVPPGRPVRPYSNTLKTPLVSVMATLVLMVGSGLLLRDPDSDLCHRSIGVLLKRFVPLYHHQEFSDVWYRALPADDQVLVDSLIRTYFTEVWLPIEHTDRVLSILERMYEDQLVSGNFAVEIYGAKCSPFWLSPAYEQDVIRIDPYWWAYNLGDPTEYFTRFWDHLLDVPGARLHWGKFMPRPGQQCGKTVFDSDHLKRVYPRMNDWLARRAEMDPHGVFLTDYWRGILGIG